MHPTEFLRARGLKLALLAAVAAGGVTVQAQQQLYTTGPYDPELAFASDAVPGQANNQRLAEAFVLSSDSSISDVHWWGRSEGAFFKDLTNMESFTVKIFEDAGAIPGLEVFSLNLSVKDTNPTFLGTDSSNNNLYEFMAGFGGLSLRRGTYWLSAGTKNTDPNGDGFYWLASQNRISGNFAADIGVKSDWQTSGFADLALTINGAPVPEPASLGGLVLGLAALSRRRRKRS